MNRIASITPAPEAATDIVRLDHDLRNRRRMVFTTEAGRPILLDMPRAVHLRDGDGLLLDSGETVRVEAAAEPLIEITAHDLPAVVRIAWHLGNRHLPTQLLGDRLRIRHDHVIADMVTGLGGHCLAVMAAFDPEGGAYASDVPTMGHGHHHDPRHAHAHD
jgi:urease accessory protein